MNELIANAKFGWDSEGDVMRLVVEFTLEKNAEFSKLG